MSTGAARQETQAERVQRELEEQNAELREALHKADDDQMELMKEAAKLRVATKKAVRAWELAKQVLSEQLQMKTANLIRQGIEQQVEREFAEEDAGPTEEPDGVVA